MTRIFDALRKAEASRPASPTPLAPAPPLAPAGAASGPYTPPGRPLGGGMPRADALPLQGAVPLDDETLREMSTLRVSLESALPDRSPRVIMFVSPQGREGTSTVALQFALALARDPHCRPLLVDANVRRPSFEVDASRHTCLLDSGLMPAGSPQAGVISANLCVVPAPDDLRRTGVFTPAAMREVLDSTVTGFDWVVLDGPAVLESPDASPLSALADGVVLVVQSGRTKRPVLVRSADLLRKAGGRVLGSVLNRRRHEIPEFIYRRI